MNETTFLALMKQLWETNFRVAKINEALGAFETTLDDVVNGWGDVLTSMLFDPNEEWEDIIFDKLWSLILTDNMPTDEEFLKFYKENM